MFLSCISTSSSGVVLIVEIQQKDDQVRKNSVKA